MIAVDSFVHSSVDLGEVKDFVRVDTDAHDTLLAMLVESAQEECFNRTHMVFGSAGFTVTNFNQVAQLALPYLPVTAVTSVTLDGELATVDEDYYVQDDLIIIAKSYTDKVEVVYTAGAALPADVKHAIMQRVKYGYDYGDDLPMGKTPRFFDRVTDRYRAANTFAG